MSSFAAVNEPGAGPAQSSGLAFGLGSGSAGGPQAQDGNRPGVGASASISPPILTLHLRVCCAFAGCCFWCNPGFSSRTGSTRRFKEFEYEFASHHKKTTHKVSLQEIASQKARLILHLRVGSVGLGKICNLTYPPGVVDNRQRNLTLLCIQQVVFFAPTLA